MSPFRFLSFIAAPLVLLGGCSSFSFLGLGGGDTTSAPVMKYTPARQLVVGDEPFAVRVGASILAQGGSAADAATAMFFALSVTYPVAAGPAGGGICLARDPASGVVQEFDFLPRAAAGGGAYAVPGAVSGFYNLQKHFGTLPWQRDVAPAEAMADSGFPISEALAARLAGTESVVRLDAALAAEFLDESGQLKKAGTVVTNHVYARTLGAIRENGADGFAQVIGARLMLYAAAQGGALSATDLAATATRQTRAASRSIGQVTVAFPAPGTGAGAFSAALLARATSPANAVAAVRQTLASFGLNTVPADLGSTGFAVLDSKGGAVSCAVTLNGPFGSGRTATDTGVQLAAAPSGTAGLASAFLMPLIATSAQSDNAASVGFVGAAAGGPNGGAAIMSMLLKLAGGGALSGPGDMLHTGAAPKDTINLIACQSACVALPDAGGHGLGATGDNQGLGQ